MTSRSPAPGALLVLALAAAALDGQEPPTPAPGVSPPLHVVRVSTSLVQVDAVVTDRAGHHVTDLTAADFEILEDGRPQRITHCSYVPLAPLRREQPSPLAAGPGPPPGPGTVRRTIAIVVDDLRLSFENVETVRGALRKVVDEQIQPGDLVALVRTSAGLGALQQFTTDRRVLQAAVARIQFLPLRAGRTVGAFATSGGDEADRAYEDFFEDRLAVGSLGALRYVLRGLEPLPGRKSMILVSEGIPLPLRPAEDVRRRADVLEGLRGLAEMANRSSVVIYAIDPRGLPTLGLSAQDRSSGRPSPLPANGENTDLAETPLSRLQGTRATIRFLADQTGGLAVFDNNDVGWSVRRALADEVGYYLLGYDPDEASFARKAARPAYHALRVRVKRAGMTVRSRRGFYGVSDEEKPASPLTGHQKTLSALLSPFGAGDIEVKLTSLYGHDPKEGDLVHSLLHVDARGLTFSPPAEGAHATALDIVAMTFDENGRVVDERGRNYTLHFTPAQLPRLLEDGLVADLTLKPRRPGPYHLRVAVRDVASDRVGSANQFVDVPDLSRGRLALSGIVLGARPHLDSPLTAADAPADPAAAREGDPESTSAVRRFPPGADVSYVFVAYNPRLDAATGRPRLTARLRLLQDGREVHVEPPRTVDSRPLDPTKQRAVPLHGDLRLSRGIPSGEYVLEVEVVDELAKGRGRAAVQWTDFEVAK
jgi:VWFA-related protein